MRFKISIKKHLLVFLIPILAITVNSCYDDYGMSTSDYDVVLTRYDSEAKFGQYKTFALVDSIFHITEDGEDSDLLSRAYDNQILERIKSNMLAMGYTLEADPANNIPDVAVVAAATASRNFNIYSWYPGYGGWWGGWYYPWTTVTAYDLGTLLFTIIDTEDFDLEEERYIGVWIAGINGVMQKTSSNITRITSHIDQAFKQSEYLTPNQ